MIDFTPEFKISELSSKISEGFFDKDIEEHLKELLDDKVNIKDASEYFSLTIARDDGSFCYLDPSNRVSGHQDLTGKERTLLSLFEIRIKKVYGDVIGEPEPDYNVAFADAYAHDNAKAADIEKYAEYYYKTGHKADSLQTFLGISDNPMSTS
jgi:hypothetical protein